MAATFLLSGMEMAAGFQKGTKHPSIKCVTGEMTVTGPAVLILSRGTESQDSWVLIPAPEVEQALYKYLPWKLQQ